jgi:DNA mismatch repair protein MutS2
MAANPLASEATLRALECRGLLACIAQLAATDLGRAEILGLAPAASAAELDARRRRYEESRRLILDGALVPPVEEPLAELLERLENDRPPLAGPDLIRLAGVLGASRAAARRILRADPGCPALAAETPSLPEAQLLQERIEATLDRRGEVREEASPQLAALRRTIRRLREALYRQLQSRLGELREHLSEDTIPLRGGRLVLLVQAGARGRVAGLFHGRSATGRSFYFEPLETVEPNNQLQQAIEDEEDERRRILAELVAAVRAAAETCHRHAAFVGRLDALESAARFAEIAGARLADLAPDGELRLTAARHPLLDPRLAELRAAALGQGGHTGPVVPLDLHLDAAQRALVVTGPNAGGKTVALKTVGLLAFAHQCGLPVPAGAGTAFPFLERLVATVGDEQDLLADRSTFSGRLMRLHEAWDAAGPRSLLLLDELGSGTDPEEGAALAVALLEGLVERRALAVITTHLTRLAAAALELDGAGCAAMEFSGESGLPTYHLLPGPPGGSEAIALARRLGLPRAWLDRAERQLQPEFRDLRRLLAEVERTRGELAAARDALASERLDQEKIRRRMEREQAALEVERKTIATKLKAELGELRRDIARKLTTEVEKVREEARSGRRRQVAAEAVDRLFAGAPQVAGEEESAGPLAVGGTVRHRALGWQGRLETLDGERAVVVVAGKRVRCTAGELDSVAPAAPRSGRRAAPASAPGGRDLDSAVEAPAELNLIGQRVEPALEAVDGYLDQALLAARREVRIVHGHGTGRLRDAVRLHLRQHPAVAAQRPGEPNEGGNGATVVTLRGG